MIIALLLAVAGHQVVQDQTLPNSPLMLPPWFGATAIFHFSQFDPSLGTLDEVRVTTEMICAHYSVEFEATCTQSGTFSTTLPYTTATMTNTWRRSVTTIWGTPQHLAGTLELPDALTVTLPFDGTLDYAGSSGQTFVTDTTPISTSWGTVSRSWLRDATGTGRLTLTSICSYPGGPTVQIGPPCPTPVDTTVDTYVHARLVYVYH